MCLPPAAIAIGSLVVGAAGVGMQAIGAHKAAKAQQEQYRFNSAQASLSATQNQRRAETAFWDADQIERIGETNANFTLAVAGLNTNLTRAIADANVDLTNATTDFNIGVIKATTEFNAQSAEGAAALLEARGELAASAHRANADYLEVQAQDTLEAGNQAITQSRGQYAQQKGAQRARLAANGVALDEGSALRIQADTDYASDQDAETIRVNAIKAALGYRVQAVNERASADFASLDGKAAALQKRGDALAERVKGLVGVTEGDVNRSVSIANTRMTASFQIMQTNLDAQIGARNYRQDAMTQAWSLREQGQGYLDQAEQDRLSAQYGQSAANSISPGLAAGTSLVTGAAGLASQWYGYKKAGTL